MVLDFSISPWRALAFFVRYMLSDDADGFAHAKHVFEWTATFSGSE